MAVGIPTIVHLDADAFFVSVEQALRPELRGKKCAVGGRERGIISSASYEARACGVYTPMPSSQARRVCPDLILIPHTGGLYSQYSRRLFDLCETLTPLVQRNSIDEGYLDLGPCGYGSAVEAEAAVRGLQGRIWKDLGITASFGLAANKLVSQVASKLRKPRGFVAVPPGKEREFLAPLAITVLPGIGAKTAEGLTRRGIRLVRDLDGRSERQLAELFGSGWRGVLAMAHGIDDRLVETDREDAKSYSQQETFFSDVSDRGEIERVIKRMIDELMPTIRTDAKSAKTMTIKVRYPDFTQESRGRSLAEGSDVEVSFYPLVAPLLESAWTKRRPLRLVSVRFSGIEDGARQLEMFGEAEEKRRRLAGVVDRLKAGGAALHRGHQLPAEGNPATRRPPQT